MLLKLNYCPPPEYKIKTSKSNHVFPSIWITLSSLILNIIIIIIIVIHQQGHRAHADLWHKGGKICDQQGISCTKPKIF